MFFYIGNNCTLLPQRHHRLFLDDGWVETNIGKDLVWYKGYSTECAISDRLLDIISGYKPRGIWTLIHYNGKSYDIYHSKLRGFQLYSYQGDLTNIELPNFTIISNTIDFELSSGTISLDHASLEIQKLVEENIIGYVTNNPGKLNVLFSGGLDTATLWGIIDYLKIPYDFEVSISGLDSGDYLKSLGVMREYSSALTEYLDSKHWAYRITSLRKIKNTYLTGFYSELMTLRTMWMFQKLASYFDKTVYDFIDSNDYVFIFLQKNKKIFDSIHNVKKDELFLKQELVNIVTTDYQMWHIDNNYHFSPFYDERIVKISYQMPITDMITNCRNGMIQRKILERVNPQILQCVASRKNSKPFDKFLKNFQKIVLPETTIKTIR